MIEKEILGALATVICFIAYIPYFLGIFKGQIKPHIFSWIVWSILMGVAFFAQISDGAGPGAWVTAFEGLITIIVMVLALRIGEKDITKSDKISLFFALLTIPLWMATKNPLWSIILVTFIDALGFYPTFRKGYQKPWEEGLFVFAASSLQFTTALFALENISLITALYPASLVVTNGVFALMLLIRRRFIAKEALAS